MVVAKFVWMSGLQSVGQETISFQPAVYGEENKTWSKFTPSGSLSMTVTNPDVFGKFVPGKEYLLNFSEAVRK